MEKIQSPNPKSSESLIYTKCINDDSDGSILSDWMDHDAEWDQDLEKMDLKEFTSSQYLAKEDEGKKLCEVVSEYAFDINSY
uniref:Uncharacterized protein n=1 Tax=Caenorhabditis tropicalis TaxID=1561998 RepID=A0A1I7UTD1_9PELO